MSKKKQAKRIEAFEALLADYHAQAEDYDTECEEDPRPYLSGEKELERFVCITQHAEKPFFLPEFHDIRDAVSRAWEYATDDAFAESPLGVFDLDKGTLYVPDWPAIHVLPFVDGEGQGYREAQLNGGAAEIRRVTGS